MRWLRAMILVRVAPWLWALPGRAPERTAHSWGVIWCNGGCGVFDEFLGCRNHLYPVLFIQQASGIPYWERDSEHVEKAFDFGGMGAQMVSRPPLWSRLV